MKLSDNIQSAFRLILILGLSTLAACDKQGVGSMSGLNYTGEGIQHFSVDEAGGTGVGRYGGSGVVCCAMYPRTWTPDLRVTVKWKRSDCAGQWHLCTLRSKWPYKTFEKIIPIEKYTEDGSVYIVFLPHDEVRVYVSRFYPESKNFPSKLGRPKDPGDDKSYIEAMDKDKDEPQERSRERR